MSTEPTMTQLTTRELVREFLHVKQSFLAAEAEYERAKSEAGRLKLRCKSVSQTLITKAMEQHHDKVFTTEDGDSVLYLASADGTHLRLASGEDLCDIEVISAAPVEGGVS